MKKVVKHLIIFYILFVIIKTILSYFIPAPSMFNDEYVYSKMAQSFFENLKFSIHGLPTEQYPPLYPMMLSLSYIFRNMEIVYFFMKFTNAILSSLIIFPAYFISKDFLSKKRALITAILISIIPSSFAFSPFLMSENLFYPLFLFTIYFLYKAIKEDSYKWSLLTGIFVGLCLLTKVLAIILFPTLIFSFALLIKNGFNFKKIILIFIFLGITISPWLIRNILLFGFSLLGIFSVGSYSTEVTAGKDLFYFIPFVQWIIIYTGIIIISGLLIYFLMSIINFKEAIRENNKKLLILLTISLTNIIFIVLLSANHSNYSPIQQFFTLLLNGRPLIRYIDTILPLIIILGIIGFDFYEKNREKYISTLKTGLILIILILIFSCYRLVNFPLFPVNNMSLSHLGVLKSIIDFMFYNKEISNIGFSWASAIVLMILSIITILIIWIYIKKLNVKKIIFYSILFLLLVSLLNFGITFYNSDKYWYNGEQMQLGLWINSNIKERSTFLFDERDEAKILKTNQQGIYQRIGDNHSITIIGFWMNYNIIIGDVTNLDKIDYVISKHSLNLKLIKETKNKIYLYKV